ncbi:MAG: DUF1972 domain-containing protein [Rikenellaceae bacterium]
MKKVAIIGSVGVPANYGGFETLIENIIGTNCSSDVEYTVFCSARHYYHKSRWYKGARLKYIYLSANGMQSILYDGISLFLSLRGYDSVVALGVSGGIFFPLFRLFSRTHLICNIDGLEWKRGKWNGLAKWFLRFSEELALRFSHTVIADNQAIVDYIKRRYQKKTVLIAYGGDHVERSATTKMHKRVLRDFGVKAGAYAIMVARVEPENNCEMILRAFSQISMPIIMIGNWEHSKFGMELKRRYSGYNNISLIDPIYDLDTLYVLRSDAKYYIHGHSAGGTNPSLVEAMFCGCDILAYDVSYNRESTENKANYFSDSDDLLRLLESHSDTSDQMIEIAYRRYNWSLIAQQYESLY